MITAQGGDRFLPQHLRWGRIQNGYSPPAEFEVPLKFPTYSRGLPKLFKIFLQSYFYLNQENVLGGII